MSSLDNGNNRNDISNSVKLLHGNEYIVSIANFDFTFESKNPFIFIQILSNISNYIIISFQLSIRLIRNGFVTNFSLIAKMSYVNNCFKFYFRIRQETIWSYSTKGWHRRKQHGLLPYAVLCNKKTSMLTRRKDDVHASSKHVQGALNHSAVRNYSNEGTRRDSHTKNNLRSQRTQGWLQTPCVF